MRLAEWWRVRAFFDAEFYLERYPDVRQSGMNPFRHYLRHGAAEGRKPHRLFDPAYYLSCCLEARGGKNPLLHFIETRGRMGNPHPLFDCKAYLTAYPDADNPLLHYIRRQGAAGGSRADQGVRPISANLRRWSHNVLGLTKIELPTHRTFSLKNVPNLAPMGVRPTHAMKILDVEVCVAFWEDADGRLRVDCEPQQEAFFRAMRFDQLAAQVKP